MIKLKSLIKEEFEDASKFVQNPEHNETPFSDLLKQFQSHGGQFLGSGKGGQVFYHPSWKYVLKIFTNDEPYLKFVRFALKNPRKSFPKFLDKPRSIVPNYKRHKSQNKIYIVKMEKLKPINREIFKEIDFYIRYFRTDWNYYLTTYTNSTWQEMKESHDEIEKKYPYINKFAEDYYFLMDNANDFGAYDVSDRNIMRRDNGEFVLTDPFWVGETPYQTYDRLMRAEIGYEDYNEPDESEYVKGGKKWKPKKTPKPVKKTSIVSPDEEIPF